MRLRADQQLFLTYLALIMALTLATSFGAGAVVRNELVEGVAEDLEREALLASRIYTSEPAASAESIAGQLAEATARRVTLVDSAGRLLADVGPGANGGPILDDYRIRPEIQSALRTGSGRAIRVGQTGDQTLYVAMLNADGSVLRVGSELLHVDRAIEAIQQTLFGVAALGTILALFFAFGFNRSVVAPLRRIGDAARGLAAGDLSRRVRFQRDDELGDLGGALNALADELQRRLGQLEGERAEMQALIDAMSEAVLAISPGGTLRRANPAARRIFALGDRISGVAPEMISRRPEFLALVSRALNGETVQPRELAGGGIYLLATAHPLPDGGAVLVFLDVTELRRLEGVRRDFVANASHELKTPLTAIRGYSETLADPELPPDLVRRFADIVKANADRLQRIVDDLLDLSRIEAGGWVVQPSAVDLETLVNDVWASVNRAEKEIELTFDLAPGHSTVWADSSALRQVFSNLLNNACRYTQEGGTITIRAFAEEGSDPRRTIGQISPADVRRWTQIEVVDTGTGIPAAHLSRIFERFYRVDPARSREEGGTGLGLSIVKHLIESHGGWIDAESEVGRGTTIAFAIPSNGQGGRAERSDSVTS